VPTLIADLAMAAGRDRDNLVVALRVLGDRRASPALRAALKDKSPYVRGIAVAALGELKSAKAYDEIVALTLRKIAPWAMTEIVRSLPKAPQPTWQGQETVTT
jgi:hypothetical protein